MTPSIVYNVLIFFVVINLSSQETTNLVNCTTPWFDSGDTRVQAVAFGNFSRSGAYRECRKHEGNLLMIKSSELEAAFEKWLQDCCKSSAGEYCTGFVDASFTGTANGVWQDGDRIDTAVINIGGGVAVGDVVFRYTNTTLDLVGVERDEESATDVLCALNVSQITSPTPVTTSSAASSTPGSDPSSPSKFGTRTTISSATNATSDEITETPMIVWVSVGMIVYSTVHMICLFFYVRWHKRREKREKEAEAAEAEAAKKQGAVTKVDSDGGSNRKRSAK